MPNLTLSWHESTNSTNDIDKETKLDGWTMELCGIKEGMINMSGCNFVWKCVDFFPDVSSDCTKSNGFGVWELTPEHESSFQKQSGAKCDDFPKEQIVKILQYLCSAGFEVCKCSINNSKQTLHNFLACTWTFKKLDD